MSDFTFSFDAAEAADPQHSGAKVARLAQLAASGHAVPKGFVVTTAAFSAFIEESPVGREIGGTIRIAESANSEQTLREAATAIAALGETVTLPDAIAAALRHGYEQLCLAERRVDLPVAVRSSATGEDAKDASFAGQYESLLGMRSVDAVAQAVVQCWLSLFNERALLYRQRAGLSFADTPMAVAVMTLVEARAAGVAFSEHPVKRTSDRVVIEGTFGFGEALVQGIVTPDHAELDKADLRILDYQIGEKTQVSILDAALGKVVERPMPDTFRTARVLDDEELQALAQTVRQLEEEAGHAVDVEWVLPVGRQPGQPVAVVQLRPITGKPANEAPSKPTWSPGHYASKYGVRKRAGRNSA